MKNFRSLDYCLKQFSFLLTLIIHTGEEEYMRMKYTAAFFKLLDLEIQFLFEFILYFNEYISLCDSQQTPWNPFVPSYAPNQLNHCLFTCPFFSLRLSTCLTSQARTISTDGDVGKNELTCTAGGNVI